MLDLTARSHACRRLSTTRSFKNLESSPWARQWRSKHKGTKASTSKRECVCGSKREVVIDDLSDLGRCEASARKMGGNHGNSSGTYPGRELPQSPTGNHSELLPAE